MSDQKVVVVTDSTAYIPEKALGGLNIPVIPLWVLWGNDRFRDGVDMDPPTFYRRLKETDIHPTTSQPSVGEFESFFRQVGAKAEAVVGVFVTSKLSGTFANAQAVQQTLTKPIVRVVDSLSVSMGQGFIALAAARAAAAGKSLDKVVDAAENMKEKVELLFAVDTLEYLHRGGRVGGAKWLVGTALSIKPLLHFVNGAIEPLAQVRTKRKVIQRMLGEAKERLGGKKIVEAAVIDADNPEEGDGIAEQVKQLFGISTVYRAQISPVIGTHAGPGTVGLAFYTE